MSIENGNMLIKSLSGKKSLKSLALNNCRLTLSLLQELANSIKDNESLKELYLYSNMIGPEEAP